jgi:hypothetical protein
MYFLQIPEGGYFIMADSSSLPIPAEVIPPTYTLVALRVMFVRVFPSRS